MPETKLFDAQTGILNFVAVSSLKEGMSFGEKGLDVAAPRNATVICISNTDFACVLRKDYDQLLKEMTKAQNGKIQDFFFTTVFKRALGRGVVDNIGADFGKILVTLSKGTVVFHQGAIDNKVYIIKQGSLQLEHNVLIDKKVKPEDNYLKGKSVKKTFMVSTVSEGEIFGEECIFSNEPKRFTAKVHSETAVVYYVSKECIKAYTKMLPSVEEFFRHTYTERKNLRDSLLNKLFIQGGVLEIEKEIHDKPVKKEWSYTKPFEKNPIMNFEDFDKKYHNEIRDFVRVKVPSRNPRFAMLKDFENSLQHCVIPKAEMKELEYLVSRDFNIDDRMHIELEVIKKRIRDPRRLLKVKLSSLASGALKDRDRLNVSKSLENSSIKGSSFYDPLQVYSSPKKARTTRDRSLNLSSMPNTATSTTFNIVLPKQHELDPHGTDRSLTLPSAYRQTGSISRVPNNTGTHFRSTRKPSEDFGFEDMPLRCKISPLLYSGSVSKTADLIKKCKLT